MPIEPEADISAAELALGVLEGEERTAAMRRVLSDPAFAREVETWRNHFATLFAETRAIDPPPQLKGRIEVLLFPRRVSRFLWPAIATALAASLVLAIHSRPVPAPTLEPAQATSLIATLDPGASGAPIAAVYDHKRAEIRISGSGPAKPGRSAELWMIGQDGVPRSLGLLAPAGRSAIFIAPALRAKVAPGVKLAISSEPPGGSQTGAPTGPVLAIGTLIAI